MRKRRLNRRGTGRSITIKWGIFVALLFAFAGVSYAAHTNVLTSFYEFGTGNMSFVFDKSEDVVVQIRDGSDGEERNLDCDAVYKDKKLTISNIGPISITAFSSGNAEITIHYAIEAEDKKKGMQRPAEVKKNAKSGYDLGTIKLELQSHTPVWSLENGELSIGTKSKGIDGTPDIIYDFLPDHLGKFHIYNQMRPHLEDGVMIGTLLLKQESVPDIPDTDEINLSGLGLPDEANEKIESDSLLEIRGTYGFTIPLDLNQFNVEE